MKFTGFVFRRHEHVGVINGAVWSAHDRRVQGTTEFPRTP